MDIISRADWGARPPKNPPRSIPTPSPELWLHHSASADGETLRVRAIQRYHQNVKGWNDIAYSYLISGSGTIYEGRGAGVSGAHTKNHNSISHGICVMGNFNLYHPTKPSLTAVVELLQHGHAEGWWPDQLTGGHRDVGSTSCPGHNLYPLIPDLNIQAEDTMSFKAIYKQWTAADIDQMYAKGLFAGDPGYWKNDIGTYDHDWEHFTATVLAADTALTQPAAAGPHDHDGVYVKQVTVFK